jgi:hypothetical protein
MTNSAVEAISSDHRDDREILEPNLCSIRPDDGTRRFDEPLGKTTKPRAMN